MICFQTQLTAGARVGADPRLIPHHIWERWHQVLDIMGINLVQVQKNLIDEIWTSNRPNASRVQMYVHKQEFAGNFYTSIFSINKYIEV